MAAKVSALDELLAAEFALRQLKLDVLGHLGGAGVDGAGGADVVSVPPGHGGRLALDLGVRRGDVVALGEILDARIGRLHAERLEEALGEQVVPRGLRGFCRGLPGGKIENVVVHEGGADLRRRFHLRHTVQNLVAIERCAVPDQVVARQAGPVAEAVADRQFVGIEPVGHAEIRQVHAQGVVPLHFLFIDQHGDEGAGERLRDGADGEESFFRDRIGLADFLDAEAAGENGLAVLHDGDADARCAVRFQGLEHFGFEPLERVGSAEGCGTDEQGEQGKSHHGGLRRGRRRYSSAGSADRL